MGKVVKKKMTMDDLAVMVANGFSGVANRFDKVEVDIKNIDKKIDTKVDELKSQIAGVNNRIDDISMNRVKYEDHNKLKTRVDFIEEKLEIKK